jgi:hypothetical protein
MNLRARALPFAASLCALALGGCLSTKGEPFALDGGDEIAAQPGEYVCRTIDAHGNARSDVARLIELRRNHRPQYVFLAPDNSAAEPSALHKVQSGVYLVALAQEAAPGEDLYLATVSDGAAFRVYEPAASAHDHASALATQNGATLTHGQFSDQLTGPLAAQRAFALALAGDLKNWRLAADCRAKHP